MQPYSHPTIQKVHRCPVIRYSLSVGRPSARQPQSHKIHRFVAVSSLAAPFFLLVLPSGHRTKWLPSLPPALPKAFFAAYFQKNKKSPWVGCLAALVISLFSARACPTCHPQAHRSRSLGVAAASIGRRRSLKLPAWLHFFGPRLSSRAGAIARTSRVNPGSCMRCLFQRAIPTAWTSLVNPSSCMPWVV